MNDASGRTFSGQTIEAFWTSVEHANPFWLVSTHFIIKDPSVGLNCSLGILQIKPFLETLSAMASCYVAIYPNAGIPDELGQYRETAEDFASVAVEYSHQR